MTYIKHLSQGKNGADGSGKKRRRSLSAFILSGGGARGAYECGVYQSLVEHGVDPDVLVGTSVGAINATAIAMGMAPRTLTEIWLSIASKKGWLPTEFLRKARILTGNKNVFSNRTDIWNFANWTYLFDTHPLRATLIKYFDPDALKNCRKELVITAVEIQSGQSKMFRNEEISLEHVLASASIPIVFPWTRIGEEIYWDGGLLANVPPLRTAIGVNHDVTDVYMVKLFPTMARKPRTLLECVERAIEITLQGALNQEIANIEFINTLIEEGRIQGDFRPIKLHTIEFTEPLAAMSIIDFSYNHVKQLVEQGKRDADMYFMARSREEVSRRRALRSGNVDSEADAEAPKSRRKLSKVRVAHQFQHGPTRG
jgi:NTE family protein